MYNDHANKKTFDLVRQFVDSETMYRRLVRYREVHGTYDARKAKAFVGGQVAMDAEIDWNDVARSFNS